MTQKHVRKLMLEIARRIYLQEHGTLKGFGKIASYYRSNWKPDAKKLGGYKAIWENEFMLLLRNNFGM